MDVDLSNAIAVIVRLDDEGVEAFLEGGKCNCMRPQRVEMWAKLITCALQAANEELDDADKFLFAELCSELQKKDNR